MFWTPGGRKITDNSLDCVAGSGLSQKLTEAHKKDHPVRMRNVNVNGSPFIYINPSED